MPMSSCELKVIGRPFLAEHYAIKAIMAVKATQYLETEALLVERYEGFKIIGGSSDPDLR